MKRNLLLFASAALVLALPAASSADPPADKGHGGGQDQEQQHEQGGGNKGQPAGGGGNQGHAGVPAAAQGARTMQGGGGQGGGHAAGGATARPVAPAVSHAQTQGARPQAGAAQVERHAPPPATLNRPAAPVSHAQTGVRATPAASGHGPVGQAPKRPTAVAPAARTRQGQARPPAAQFAQKPAGTAKLGGWSRPARGPARDQAAQQWRQGHQGWDQSAPWRRDRNWWRGNDAFSLYVGVRSGFFFIPEIGYVSAPRQYWDHHWQAGQYLPNWFWRYQVRDFWNYGLPEPPDGCVWVWVNNDMALIDSDDGYILDIVHNAW